MSIQVQNLSKSFGSQKVLNNISFEVNKSEILGFLGPNGAGKTTTMRIITGSLSYDQGQIKISDRDISENPIFTKSKIGYLAEHNPLYQEMYVREFLDFTANIFKIENKKKKIDEMIELTGLKSEQNKKIKFLSKGYKQRVGLAHVLIHDPEILILDEPTSGLDPNQLREIRTLIKRTGQNKTVIFSTHIMQEVKALCDRVIILNKGSIVADCNIQDIDKYYNENLKSVLVEFENNIDIEALKKLLSIKHVESISPLSFRLRGNDDKKMKREVFDFAKNNNYVLTSIGSEDVDIDTVFANLTN